MTENIKKNIVHAVFRQIYPAKAIMVLILMGCFYLNIYAVDIQVTDATRQSWSGGICCRKGVNYNIGLLIFPSKHSITLDSLWLEGNCRSLSSYNYKGRTKNDTLSVYIMDGLSYDGGIQVDGNWCKDPTKKGVIISYYKNKEKFLLDITPYIKDLFPLAYP